MESSQSGTNRILSSLTYFYGSHLLFSRLPSFVHKLNQEDEFHPKLCHDCCVLKSSLSPRFPVLQLVGVYSPKRMCQNEWWMNFIADTVLGVVEQPRYLVSTNPKAINLKDPDNHFLWKMRGWINKFWFPFLEFPSAFPFGVALLGRGEDERQGGGI